MYSARFVGTSNGSPFVRFQQYACLQRAGKKGREPGEFESVEASSNLPHAHLSHTDWKSLPRTV